MAPQVFGKLQSSEKFEKVRKIEPPSTMNHHFKFFVLLLTFQPITIRQGSQHCQAVLSLVEIFADKIRTIVQQCNGKP